MGELRRLPFSPPKICHIRRIMRLHASCASRQTLAGDDALLLLGPAGAGKSDLLLRLIDAASPWWPTTRCWWKMASPAHPRPWPGCWKCAASASSACPIHPRPGCASSSSWVQPERLPPPPPAALGPARNHARPGLGLRPERAALALEAACGRVPQLAGAFSA